MNDTANLQRAAALLERAYRLALVLQDVQAHGDESTGFVAAELVEVLDEARVALLKRPAEALGRGAAGGRP